MRTFDQALTDALAGLREAHSALCEASLTLDEAAWQNAGQDNRIDDLDALLLAKREGEVDGLRSQVEEVARRIRAMRKQERRKAGK